jgi:hypothetical protein
MLKKLHASHRQLEASAKRLSSLIDAALPDAEAVQAARWDIGTRILQHMALEDRHLLANLAKDKRPAVAALARKYQTEFAGHVASYAEHAKTWTAERVAADWDGYRTMTREQLRLLLARVQQVETELFPLATSPWMPLMTPPSVGPGRPLRSRTASPEARGAAAPHEHELALG